MGTLTWLGLQRVRAAQSPPAATAPWEHIPAAGLRVSHSAPSGFIARPGWSLTWGTQLTSVRPGPEASLAERSL